MAFDPISIAAYFFIVIIKLRIIDFFQLKYQVYFDNNYTPLSEKQIENEKKYLKENLEVELVYFESELIGLNLPEKVEYKVTYTTDAVKGNTSTNALKDATLENGLEVKVPLFICEGDVVVISTKDGKYVSRA